MRGKHKQSQEKTNIDKQIKQLSQPQAFQAGFSSKVIVRFCGKGKTFFQSYEN